MSTKQSNIEKLLSLFETVQKIDREFPLQYLVCFHQIALEPGIGVSELSKRTNINLSTTSRIIGALSQWRNNNAPYELIVIEPDPDERRRKKLYLTKKGEDFLKKLIIHLDT